MNLSLQYLHALLATAIIMNIAIFIFSIFIILGDIPGPTYAVDKWSYDGDAGPKYWKHFAPKCHGLRQSPIDIDTERTVYGSFPPFEMIGYDMANLTSHPLSILNNGHTVQVNLNGDYIIGGGGLPSTYKAVQFHLHWGSNMSRGSEHTINGMHYAAEMHIVHYDFMNYPLIPLANEQKNGLAVLGFFIRAGRFNPAWQPIIRQLRSLRESHDTHIFDTPFSLTSLLPDDLTQFYRYSGSLTTPGCYESVVWTVFEVPIELSRHQIGQFRRLTDLSGLDDHDETHHTHIGPLSTKKLTNRLVNNYRPTQHLWFRKVYQSWPHADNTPQATPMPTDQDEYHNTPESQGHESETHHSPQDNSPQDNSPQDNSPQDNSPQDNSHVVDEQSAVTEATPDGAHDEETHNQEGGILTGIFQEISSKVREKAAGFEAGSTFLKK
ncbi:carbonic anhydrase 2-like [Amphiura filiformis]|uniref:carbonic anhydrase 2-like n=1 Tax=Amphiura filiformis TaxID=82378 RepID=UPI003B20EA91